MIERDLFVKDGLLTLPHGTQYRILVLPKLETMRPELLAKIGKLIEDGAVVLGPAPKRRRVANLFRWLTGRLRNWPTNYGAVWTGGT